MNECPRCGGEVKVGARFCPHCALDMSQMGQQNVGATIVEPRAGGPSVGQTLASSSLCPRCATPVAREQRFCPNCGSPIAAPGQPQLPVNYFGGQNPYGAPINQPVNYAAPPLGYAPPPAARSNTPLIIGIVVLVLVLAGGGVAAYLLLGKDKKNDSGTSSSLASSNARAESVNSNRGARPPAGESFDEVARKAVAAFERNDSATIRQLTARSSQEKVQEQMTNFKVGADYAYGGLTSISLTGTNVQGDAATAGCSYKFGNGQVMGDTMFFTREDGAWKITSLGKE